MNNKMLIAVLFLGVFSLGYSQSGYYNDYRKSVTDINWQNVIMTALFLSIGAGFSQLKLTNK